MAQYNWLYLGDNGRRYNVGLFHGDRTGHLMVMCNARIVLIDFSVKQAKDYSFFIDDELFELSVEGKPGSYAYNCSINEEADTPRNRIRQKQKKLDFRKSVALITIFALVMIGVLGFAMVNQRAEPPPADQKVLLNQEGLETVARIYVEANEGGPPKLIRYSFVADGFAKNYEQTWDDQMELNGFPLVSGDEFRVRYLPDQPRHHRLEWGQPTPRQIERYLERTAEKHQLINAQLSKSQARCQTQVAYRLGGVDGLAVLFNQDQAAEENTEFNQQLYEKFIRDVPFQEAVERDCWK